MTVHRLINWVLGAVIAFLLSASCLLDGKGVL
jgi:hypothetical protein